MNTKRELRRLLRVVGTEDAGALHDACIDVLTEHLRHYVEDTITPEIEAEIIARYDALETRFMHAVAAAQGVTIDELKRRAEAGEYDDGDGDETLESMAHRFSPRLQMTVEELHAKLQAVRAREIAAEERAAREAQSLDTSRR